MFEPCCKTRWDGGTLDNAQTDIDMLELLRDAYAVILAGWAGSHCLAQSGYQLLDYFLANDPDLVKKVYLLRDCTSPVVAYDGAGNIIPGQDFSSAQEKAFDDFTAAGVHMVMSTDPMESWGLRLS